ncbi:MAG: extensin family protein [Hyphomicrobium sp.]|nr:extensin family protein [Hyphomicrobium sp.]
MVALTVGSIAIASMGPAYSDDVPLPERKPRDKKGAPIVTTIGNALPGTTKSKTEANGAGLADGMRSGSKSDTEKSAETSKTEDGRRRTTDKGEVMKGPSAKGTWPKTIEDAKAEAEAKDAAEPVPTVWPDADIAAAKARCAELLKSVHAVTLPETPFRQGDCGSAAPVRLISVGRNPEVAVSPPAVLSCDMVVAMHQWVSEDVQPLAKRYLGGEVIKIENMSDYSCRNAYGRTKSKLSEHGRANALDIRGFVTAKGETAHVLSGWGETERDAKARALALEKAAEKGKTDAAQQAASEEHEPVKPKVEATRAVPATRTTIVDGTASADETRPSGTAPSFGYQPSRLGGPKDDIDPPKQPPQKMMKFLKAAHASACRIFGTTLGPEANNAHRNHFHVDMAPRTHTKICE